MFNEFNIDFKKNHYTNKQINVCNLQCMQLLSKNAKLHAKMLIRKFIIDLWMGCGCEEGSSAFC